MIVIELPRREHSSRTSSRCSSGTRDSQKTSTAESAASRVSEVTPGSYRSWTMTPSQGLAVVSSNLGECVKPCALLPCAHQCRSAFAWWAAVSFAAHVVPEPSLFLRAPRE